MEDPRVEVVGVAVVAEVQPHHVEALLEHPRGGHAHVAGLGAALPAVQQQRQADRRRPARQAAVPGLQAHAVAAVEDQFAGERATGRQQLLAAAQAHPAGRQHRLQVRIAQPRRRLVVGDAQHGGHAAPVPR